MDVGLRHLKFVVAAARYRSLRRAAEALHLRQSTMSRGIRELEEHLGVVLFVRSSGGVRPTLAGTELLATAERLLGNFDALVSRAGALGRGAAGRLGLGLPTSHAVTRLRPVLLDYARECPGVDIRLAVRPKPGLLMDLKADALDLAVTTGRATGEGIESVSLWSERILLTVPESHALAARCYANWTDLGDDVVLISRRGLGPELKELLATKLGTIGKQATIKEHAIDAEALLSLVAVGLGITLHCEGTTRMPHPGLITLEVHDGTGPTWIIYSACWRKDHTNPALAAFLALLRTHRSMVSRGLVPDT